MSAPGAYIPSHLSLPRNPKTARLSRRLKTSLPATIGHLHLLWYFAFEYAPDGDLTDFEPSDIADAIGWTGEDDFVEAAVASGFIDRDPDGRLRVHDWPEYTGKILARRAKERVRQRDLRRSSAGHTPDVQPPYAVRTQDVQKNTGLEERRGEEIIGEEKKEIPAPPGAISHSRPRPRRSIADPEPDGFAEFYGAHPKRVDRPGALKAWRKLGPDGPLREKIMAGQSRYAAHVAGKDPEYIKTPGPWLSARRWEDEIPARANGNARINDAWQGQEGGKVKI